MDKVTIGGKTVEAANSPKLAIFGFVIAVGCGFAIGFADIHPGWKVLLGVVAALALCVMIIGFTIRKVTYCKTCQKVFNGGLRTCPKCHTPLMRYGVPSQELDQLDKAIKREQEKKKLIAMVDEAIGNKDEST